MRLHLLVTALVTVGVCADGATASTTTPTTCSLYPCIVTWSVASEQVQPRHLGYNPAPSSLRANIFLPVGYDGHRRFPVVYLLHGSDAFGEGGPMPKSQGYATWAWTRNETTGISDPVQFMDVVGDVPVIFVMPDGGAFSAYANWWNGGRRSDPAWERFHLDELVPLVEQRLKVAKGRRWHAIVGQSMGGFGALYYASQRPGYFGTVVAVSPIVRYQHPLWRQEPHFRQAFGDPDAQRFYWNGHDAAYLLPNLRHTRLYVSYADNTPETPWPQGFSGGALFTTYEVVEGREGAAYVDRARAMGVPDATFRIHRGQHGVINGRRALADVLNGWGAFGDVVERPRHWTFKTVATTGDMWGLQFRFLQPPEQVVTFERDADVLSATADRTGSETVTITTSDGHTFTEQVPFVRVLPDE